MIITLILPMAAIAGYGTASATLLDNCEICGQRRCEHRMLPECPTCGSILPCDCPIFVVCKICGNIPCTCFPILLCIICKQSPCVCNVIICLVCGQAPCVCNIIICKVCKQNPCICNQPPEIPDDIDGKIEMLIQNQHETQKLIMLCAGMLIGAAAGAAFITQWKPGV